MDVNVARWNVAESEWWRANSSVGQGSTAALGESLVQAHVGLDVVDALTCGWIPGAPRFEVRVFGVREPKIERQPERRRSAQNGPPPKARKADLPYTAERACRTESFKPEKAKAL